MKPQLPRPPLRMFADLEIETRRGRATVRSSDSTIVLRTRTLGACLDILEAGRDLASRSRIAWIARATLEKSGLDLEMRHGRWLIARAGTRARRTLASRLADIEGVQIGWLGLTLGALSLSRTRPERPRGLQDARSA